MTGKTIDVPEEQLGQYGLDSTAQVQQPAQQQVTTPTTTQPSYITGHSPEEHIQALQKARADGNSAAEADIMSNYTIEIAHQKDLSSGAFDTPEQKAAKAVQTKQIAADQAQITKNKNASQAATAFLDTYNSLNGDFNSDSSKKKLAMAASKYNAAVGFGEGGKALTAGEIGILAPTLLSTERQYEPNILQKALGQPADLTRGYLKETPEEAAAKMKEALKYTDPEALKKYGDTTAPQAKDTGVNWAGDAKDIINGILGMPAGIYNRQANNLKQGKVEQLPDLIGSMFMGYVDNLNKDAGKPLEGGDIVSRIGENAKQRPISTTLDLLPFLGMLKGGKAPVVADTGAAADVAKVADVPKTNLVTKVGENLKGGAENMNELVTGGGTKELIAKGVNADEARSLSKTNLEYGIEGKPTVKGKIVATQNALTDVGMDLEKIITSSKSTWKAAELNNNIRKALIDKYGTSPEATKAIEDVVSSIAKKGEFADGKTSLTAKQIWDMRKAGDKYGPAAYNMPGNGPLLKDMAKDATGFLRKELSSKVPEAKVKLNDYGNLKTYMNDVLQDPKGLQTPGGGLFGILSKMITGGVKESSQALNQILYNVGNKMSPEVGATTAPVSAGEAAAIAPKVSPDWGYIQKVLDED